MTLVYLYLFVLFVALVYHYGVYRTVRTFLGAEHIKTSENWPIVLGGFALGLVLVIGRQFAFDYYKVPTPSMEPNYPVETVVTANKLAFGLRAPYTNNVLLGGSEPSRGQVVIIKNPRNPEATYLKRIVGLPGDMIKYVDKVLWVNGKAITNSDGRTECFSECYALRLNTGSTSVDGEWNLGESQYFVMGDNRDDSVDSRMWGPILNSHLVGSVNTEGAIASEN